MKTTIALCFIALTAYVAAENCKGPSDCVETTCNQSHGWFLHCRQGLCICSHDTFTGQPCADGLTSTCVANHDNRCADHNMHWVCLDNTCHCTKYSG